MILARPEHGEQFRPREIVARRDHLVGRVGVGEVARLIDENDPARHDARRLGHAVNRDDVCMMTGGKVPELGATVSFVTGANHFPRFSRP